MLSVVLLLCAGVYPWDLHIKMSYAVHVLTDYGIYFPDISACRNSSEFGNKFATKLRIW